MTLPAFIWPGLLVFGFVLLGIAMYVYQIWQKRQARQFVHLPTLALLKQAKAGTRRFRQGPALVYLLASLFALVAFARPTAKLLAPDNLSGIVFAIETGRSMEAWDIEPTRMKATQAAAAELISTIPKSIKIGLATFSGGGVMNVPLTNDHDRVLEAINSLGTGGGFDFSYGLLTSLKALPEDLPEDGVPGAIVLFSHGHDRSGNNPVAIAEAAAERGIPIHTIGVGTHGNNFGEDILKVVAEISGGKYYPIFSAQDLEEAHKDLGKIIRLRPRTTEVAALPALLAAGLLTLSMVLASLNRRVF
ncbi:MAG: VWA domain-containing protein [Trueperaceae bacterium]|nr:VWA domain-containing protein [Trueperaceae bacterium]